MTKTSRLFLIPVAALALITAACGDDDDGDSGAPATSAAPAAAETTAAAATTDEPATTAAAATTEAPATTAAAGVEGDITVFAAASLTESFTEIGEAFTAANPDAKAALVFDASSALVQQITEGAPADVFASADVANMTKLTDAGLNGTEPVIFATNLLTIIVAPGNPLGITGVADLANTDIKTVICAAEVPCGNYANQIFSAAGVTVTPVSLEQNVRGVVTKVTAGEADAGIVYVTDVTAAGDAADMVEIPEDINVVAEYPIVSVAASQNQEVDRRSSTSSPGPTARRSSPSAPELSNADPTGTSSGSRALTRSRSAAWTAPAGCPASVSAATSGTAARVRSESVDVPAGAVAPPSAPPSRPWSWPPSPSPSSPCPSSGCCGRRRGVTPGRSSPPTAPSPRCGCRCGARCGPPLAALVFGVPLAWLLARVSFPGRGLVRALCTLSMVLPPVVAGVALFYSLGRRGPARPVPRPRGSGSRLPFTTAGVIVAQTFVAMPFLVITVEAAFRQLDTRYEDAARTLGASRWYVFRRVTLPAIRPGLVAGAVLAWARALGEFGATITFAGNFPGRTQTMPLAIYLTNEINPDEAIVLSLVLIAVSFGVLVALRDRFLGGGRPPAA